MAVKFQFSKNDNRILNTARGFFGKLSTLCRVGMNEPFRYGATMFCIARLSKGALLALEA